jgi:hypothetical protein
MVSTSLSIQYLKMFRLNLKYWPRFNGNALVIFLSLSCEIPGLCLQ